MVHRRVAPGRSRPHSGLLDDDPGLLHHRAPQVDRILDALAHVRRRAATDGIALRHQEIADAWIRQDFIEGLVQRGNGGVGCPLWGDDGPYATDPLLRPCCHFPRFRP